VQLLCRDPATAPHERGVLVLDDTGDRKDGTATAHAARQYLGSVGKIDNGIVAVTSLWADERCYWPAHAVPYTPASRLAKGKRDPGFRTKPQLAVELVAAAQQAGIGFRAVVADCFYGDNPGFTDALTAAKVPFVLALKPRKGTWAPADQAHTPTEAAGELGWHGPSRPGQWRRVIRRFRDGHTEAWWAADAQLGGWGPNRRLRLVVATTDPARLPGHSSWYLLTNLARPASRRAQQADLAEVVRLYGLGNWVEQGYKQVKSELGWADFQVRSDRAIRRHWALVTCAFSFCWQAWLPTTLLNRQRPTRRPSRRPRGGQQRPDIGAEPAVRHSWPVAVRAVRAWLTPWSVLARCWRSWSPAPPPRQLQRLLDGVAAG
jgi:DDE superfamily endonuclease